MASNSPPDSPLAGHHQQEASSYVLHSPLSPLTPGSPTFPDGLLTPLWATKHQSQVPAAVINFFPLSLDPTMSSLRDNQLRIEINELKRQWAATGFKTRFVVVLRAEDDGDSVYLRDVEDRVASVRRMTGLDPKSLFVLRSDAPESEVGDWAVSVMQVLHPSIVEYYRDLSKHARRKRNRSTIPPPTAPPTSGTSQTLSAQGWNARYEFKLGVFAEFRHEMDAACKSYENAYGILFDQEVFENIAGWSPRFNDARLLGDCIAVRIIRCLLWTDQTAAAVRLWLNHQNRCRDIVSRRGKGTKNYGWAAWEARWSMIMAQLIRRAEIFTSIATAPGPHAAAAISQQTEPLPIFLVPEKKTTASASSTAADRVGHQPWELLHHEGYWLYRSAKHSKHRRMLAHQIPQEDRAPPGQSSASQLASKSYLYDTYLVPETHVEVPQSGQNGFDHSRLIIDTLKDSLEEFAKRRQTRKAESISFEIAEEYVRMEQWREAYETLLPIWRTLSWRRSQWWELMANFGWLLRDCALHLQEAATLVMVDWELMNNGEKKKEELFPNLPLSMRAHAPPSGQGNMLIKRVMNSVSPPTRLALCAAQKP